MASIGWAYSALFGSDAELSKAASQGQIYGVVLTAIGIVVTLFVAERDPVDQHTSASARIVLATDVYKKECRVRTALLGGVVLADVGFHTSARSPREGLTLRVRQVAARLLSWQEEGRASAGSLSDIADYYRGLPEGRLLIVGEKGSGKTILAMELVIALAEAAKDNPDTGWPVPVRLSAVSWTVDRDLPGWLTEHLSQAYDVPRAEAAQLVDDRQILPVLDGLDEMDGDDAPPARAAALIGQVNRYYAGRAFAPVVVTTRADSHSRLDRLDVALDHAHTIRVLPLGTGQITGYLAARHRDQAGQRRAWQPVLDGLKQPDHASVRALLSTPWRLMLAVTMIDDDPVAAAHLAPRPGETGRDAQARMESTLLSAFIPAATRKSDHHDSRYRPEDVRRWLTHIARHLDWQASEAKMSPVDIVPHLIWPIGGRYLPRLLHVAAVAGLLLIGAILYVPKVLEEKDPYPFWPIGVAACLWCVGWMLSVAVGWWPEPGIWRRRRRVDRYRAGSWWLACGVTVGLLSLRSVSDIWRSTEVVAIAFMCAVLLAFFGLIWEYDDRRRWDEADTLTPHEAVRTDLVWGLTRAVTFALYSGFSFCLGAGWSTGSGHRSSSGPPSVSRWGRGERVVRGHRQSSTCPRRARG
ncbi:NACHT domain-containing protein [Nonomuraea sp. NPDC049750]|uniref:NACHT domain-containing protein n=1 Tax=Nonomuraea sp. NPDC049750 TaxID=3154738 RepID=UPI0033E136DC